MRNIKETVALTSIAASAAMTLAKGVVGVLTGSLAILSEAAHSLIDLGATMMTYFAVRISGKPADEEHHYGHGKVESVSALAETALLFVLSGVVIWEAGKRLLGEQAMQWRRPGAFARDRGFDRRRFLSCPPALSRGERDGERSAGSGCAAFRLRHVVLDRGAGRPHRRRARIPVGDSAAAIIVAMFVCVAGWRLGRRTIETLTDTAPAGSAETSRAIVGRVPASSRSSACGCGRRATSCSSMSTWRSAAPCRLIASRRSRPRSRGVPVALPKGGSRRSMSSPARSTTRRCWSASW